MDIRAVIDIGTNSFKLLVMSADGGRVSVLADRSDVVKLGDGLVYSGSISGASMERGLPALVSMVEEARRAGASDIAIVATQVMRAASNPDVFAGMVKAATGLDIRVLSGDEEASLSFRAAVSRLPRKSSDIIVVDIGGGSTEVIAGEDGNITKEVSVPLGALVLHNEFLSSQGIVRPSQVDAARERARKHISAMAGDIFSGAKAPLTAVGIGGTITTLGSVMLSMAEYDPERITGRGLPLGEVERQIGLYSSMTAEERKSVRGLDPRRAEIVLAGACIVAEVIKLSGMDCIVMSDRGLRYGVMEDTFGLV